MTQSYLLPLADRSSSASAVTRSDGAVAPASTGGGFGGGNASGILFPYFPGLGYPSNTGIPITPLTAMQAAAVYCCCKCISEDIAGLRLQVRRAVSSGGWVVDTTHPLNRLFARPNRWQTRFLFWVFLLVAYCLRGNAYAVIVRDKYGSPVELVPIWPDSVALHRPLEAGGRVWYTVNSLMLGGSFRVPAENILHFKNMSLDGYIGLSPIACAQDVIGLALATQQHGAVLFRQGASINGVLTHPGRIGKEAMDVIAESWRQIHTGVQNAHKIAVLEEGMKFEKIAMTSEDAQFLQTRQFQVLDICRIYRVPPHKLAEFGRATFNNLEQQQQQYIDDCLGPTAQQAAGVLEDGLLWDFERDDLEIRWDFSALLQGDMAQRYGAYQIGLNNGFLNRNEVRAREGMNPIPGGNEYRVPLNTGNPLDPTNAAQQIPTDGGNGADDGQEGDDDPDAG